MCFILKYYDYIFIKLRLPSIHAFSNRFILLRVVGGWSLSQLKLRLYSCNIIIFSSQLCLYPWNLGFFPLQCGPHPSFNVWMLARGWLPAGRRHFNCCRANCCDIQHVWGSIKLCECFKRVQFVVTIRIHANRTNLSADPHSHYWLVFSPSAAYRCLFIH